MQLEDITEPIECSYQRLHLISADIPIAVMMARAGMNPKTLQYLMGHSDIGVTMNTYTHLGATDARAELERLHLAGTSDRHKSRKIVGLN